MNVQRCVTAYTHWHLRDTEGGDRRTVRQAGSQTNTEIERQTHASDRQTSQETLTQSIQAYSAATIAVKLGYCFALSQCQSQARIYEEGNANGHCNENSVVKQYQTIRWLSHVRWDGAPSGNALMLLPMSSYYVRVIGSGLLQQS